MNTRLFEEAQVQMEAAEVMRQELIVLGSAVPFDQEAFDAKHEEFGAAFILASASVAEATYAAEDPEPEPEI